MSEQEFSFGESGVAVHAKTAQDALARVEDRLQDGISEALDRSLSQIEEISVEDIETRGVRADVSQVIEDLMTDSKDLARVTTALHAMAEEQGSELSNFENMHPAAQQIIDDADAEVIAANSDLAVANAMGFVANMTGAKQKAINAANTRIANAEQRQKAAPAAAQEKHREMLQNADMEESNQHIQAMHERANEIVLEKKKSAEIHLDRREKVLETTRKRLVKVAKEQESSRKKIDKAQIELDKLIAKQDSGSLEQGSEEFKVLEDEISSKNAEIGTLKGKADSALGLANELEEKLAALDMQRDALINLIANYDRSYKIGTAAAKINKEIASVRLEIIQGLSDLEIQTELNSVSRTNTIKSTQGAADAINAVERARITYQKIHPKVMAAQQRIADDLVANQEYIAEEDADYLEAYKNGFDIRPSDSRPERVSKKDNSGSTKPKPTSDDSDVEGFELA